MNRGLYAVKPFILSIAVCFLFFLIPPIIGQDLTRTIVYSVPGMDDVRVRPNNVYKRDNGEEMKMDFYIPPGLEANTRRPAILFIHGGPLGQNVTPAPKDWGVYQSYGRLMAASGFVGVTFNYRYAGTKTKDLETSFSDVDAAIQFVRTNAASNNIDPERIALWAFSGGGPHLSLGLRGQATFIRCMVSYYAILDLESDVAPFREKPDAPEKFSPVAYLTETSEYLPPVLIARAGLDYPSFNRSVALFASKMFALNGDVAVLSHPFGRHGFDVEDNNEQTREIIAATVAFLKSRLNSPTVFETRRARAAAVLQALLSEGKIEEAQNHVRTTLNSPGDKAVVGAIASEQGLITTGMSLLSSNQTAALAAFSWAVELNPLSPISHFYLAQSYETVGRIDQAVAEARKTLDLLEKASGIDDASKKAIQGAATALLGRHK
jgi:acetyl esterase/lipase